MLAPARVGAIEALQLSLLRAGFALLRRGGTMVYSTCSLSRRQNEDNVLALLRAEPEAVLVPVLPPVGEAALPPPAGGGGGTGEGGAEVAVGGLAPGLAPPPCEAGEHVRGGAPLQHTVRFAPHLGTSGLFIAKFVKR